jgi:hypothetical protein
MKSASFSMLQNPCALSAPTVVSRAEVRTDEPSLPSIATQLLMEFREHCGQLIMNGSLGNLARDVVLPEPEVLPSQWENSCVWESAEDYFKSDIFLSVQKNNSRKTHYDRRKIPNMKTGFFFDPDVYEAAIVELRSR